jgi:hypothetical protein
VFVFRAIHGVEIFGGQERVTMCVDQVMPQSVMNLIGFSKCSKLIAEEMAAEQARQDALLASGNYTYAPPAPGVGEGAEVEVRLFGYFWLFFGYFWLFFGYFWLFLVIFGNFRMGNSNDVVFCSTRTGFDLDGD